MMKNIYLWSNLSKKAINIPGITMSPKPNIAKFLAPKMPFSNKSWGNITVIKKRYKLNSKYCTTNEKASHKKKTTNYCFICKLTFNWSIKRFSNCNHNISAKYPEYIIDK